MDLRDLNGKLFVSEYTNAALKYGSAWVDYLWYKPGSNAPGRKEAFVRRVQFGPETYVIGSGIYVD